MKIKMFKNSRIENGIYSIKLHKPRFFLFQCLIKKIVFFLIIIYFQLYKGVEVISIYTVAVYSNQL